MKLILHLGTEKTGSSSLQRWLSLNSGELIARGIWYSSSLGRQDNRWIAVYAQEFDPADDGFSRAGIDSRQDHEEFCRRIETEFAREVEAAKSKGCYAFVVSSEHLHSRIVSRDMVGRLKALVDKHFDDVEIICYLRPQSQLLQSRISVGVRNFTLGPHELKTFLDDTRYYDYLGHFERWKFHFENIRFLPFRRRPDVVTDLSDYLDIDRTGLTLPLRVNENLDYRCGLMAFNLKMARDPALPFDLYKIGVDKIMCEKPIKISRGLAEEIQEKYRKCNVELAKKCALVEIDDLEGDLDAFPIHGTAEKMFDLWEGRDVMAQAILHLNCEVKLERLRAVLATCEVDLLRGRIPAAREKVSRARADISSIMEAEEKKFPQIVRNLQAECTRLENEIGS